MVYSRKIEHQGTKITLTFGHEGMLYKGSFIMYDKQTDSKWNHSTGLCMKGALKGKQLEFLPARVTLWQKWLERHPDTKVLLGRRRSGFMGGYLRENRVNYGVAVSKGFNSRLYPYEILNKKPVLNDTFLNRFYVVVFDSNDLVALAFDRTVEGKVLTFESVLSKKGDRLLMKDRETGSLWDRIAGRCIDGELDGETLRQAITVPWLIDRWRDIYQEGGSMYSETME